MRDPKQALTEHFQKILIDYPNYKFLGIFLYGSQNYGLATEESDVDSIAIVIPTIEDIILRKPICKEIIFENGEHCNVKDIREVVKEWKKQSLQQKELLSLFQDKLNKLISVILMIKNKSLILVDYITF